MTAGTGPDEDVMLRTAYQEIYDELCDVKKIFRLRVHLFTTALVLGLLYNIRSEKKMNHDLIRLSQLRDREGEWNMQEQKDLIDVLVRVCCRGKDKRDSSLQMMSFADGGLKRLYEEYRLQGVLDLSRILEEAKKAWPQRIKELLNEEIKQ